MPEPTLAELQAWFKSKMRRSPASKARVRLNSQAGDPGESRIVVYADGFRARMREALSEMYEAVEFVLGEKAFAALSERYADQYPSKHYNLSLSGQYLPEFLRQHATRLYPQYSFLFDLACLERAVSRAFHAQSLNALTAAEFARYPAETLSEAGFEFQPYVHLVRSTFPILDIWRKRHGTRPASDEYNTSKPQNVWIVRIGVSVQCRSIEDWQALFLEALIRRQSLSEACARIEDDLDDPAQLTHFLSGIVSEGFITRLRTPDAISA